MIAFSCFFPKSIQIKKASNGALCLLLGLVSTAQLLCMHLYFIIDCVLCWYRVCVMLECMRSACLGNTDNFGHILLDT